MIVYSINTHAPAAPYGYNLDLRRQTIIFHFSFSISLYPTSGGLSTKKRLLFSGPMIIIKSQINEECCA